MSELFEIILNMSLLGGGSIVFVLLVRLLFRKLPKKFSYWLWTIPAMRLVLPFGFEFSFSFLTPITEYRPWKAKLVANLLVENVSLTQLEMAEPWIQQINQIVLPEVGSTPISMMMVLSSLWLLGLGLFLAFTVYQYIAVHYSIRHAIVVDGVHYASNIKSPFLFGLIHPKIVMPIHLEQDKLAYVLAHEQVHLLRKDYLIKMLGYLILMVHWFNPLVWLGFSKFEKDMEMSCDELVIERIGYQHKVAYGDALLSVAKNGASWVSFPCFKETGVKSRIVNVLAYRKMETLMAICLTVVIAVVFVGCTSNPISKVPMDRPLNDTEEADKPRSLVYEDVLTTIQQGLFAQSAVYQDKVYIAVTSQDGNQTIAIDNGIYEVTPATSQYRLLLPIGLEFTNQTAALAIWNGELYHQNGNAIHRLNLETNESSLVVGQVGHIVGIKHNQLLYFGVDKNSSKPGDLIGAGSGVVMDLMMLDLTSNQTVVIGEYHIVFQIDEMYAYDDYLYVDLEQPAAAIARVDYATGKTTMIKTNNKTTNTVYQYNHVVYFADKYNHSVRAMDQYGLRVLARNIQLDANGVATKDGIYFFSYQQYKFAKLDLLHYDGTVQAIADLTGIVGGFSNVQLHRDYIYFMGQQEVDRIQFEPLALYRYDLHDNTVSRLDDPSKGGITSYQIYEDYIVCAGLEIQLLKMNHDMLETRFISE